MFPHEPGPNPIISYGSIVFGISDTIHKAIGGRPGPLEAYKGAVQHAADVLESARNTLVEATGAKATPIVSLQHVDLGISNNTDDIQKQWRQTVNWEGILQNYAQQLSQARNLLREAYSDLYTKIETQTGADKRHWERALAMATSHNEAQKGTMLFDIGGQHYHINLLRAKQGKVSSLLWDDVFNNDDELVELPGYKGLPEGQKGRFIDRNGEYWSRVLWPNPHNLADQRDLAPEQQREHTYAGSELLNVTQEFKTAFKTLLAYTENTHFTALQLYHTTDNGSNQYNHTVVTADDFESKLTDWFADAANMPLTFTFDFAKHYSKLTHEEQTEIQNSCQKLNAKLDAHEYMRAGYIIHQLSNTVWVNFPHRAMPFRPAET